MPDRTDALGAKPALRLEDGERTRCEVWTRVMGYHRPVSAFNAGKRAEHGERQYFTECAATTEEPIERVA
ncbi:MAG: anaerobic ribonucleoside-triphosphate reductase [Candidatus Thiosymbion ectosymbiont of Robbea hypermnestra]|nr:anaerobic ribonucleoside-triphosphate reductase [Candidatus Thiosymbion ectosymbiont of Robbea hypermnestra]